MLFALVRNIGPYSYMFFEQLLHLEFLFLLILEGCIYFAPYPEINQQFSHFQSVIECLSPYAIYTIVATKSLNVYTKYFLNASSLV